MTDHTMNAVMLLGQEQLEIQQVARPVPGDGEVLVQVEVAALCGTDIKLFRRGHPKFPPPLIIGHEFAGKIVEAGPGVYGFTPGMRVTANVFGECGECFFCRSGQGNLCENLEYNFGACAEYNLVPASIVRRTLFEIPGHVSSEEAALMEPLVSVLHAAEKLAVREGERALLIGAGGPISLLFIQLLRLAGAADITAVGHSEFRLALATEAGADLVLNSREQDPEQDLMERSGGRGFDIVVECAGSAAAWQDAVRYCRRGGRVLWFGGLPGGAQVTVDAGKVHYGEVQILNSHGGTAEDARRAMDLISSGRIRTGFLVTDRMPMYRVQEAVEQMIAGSAVRIMLFPAFQPV